MDRKIFLSEISSIESSEIYMSLKTIMFEIDKPNLNSVLVTSNFVNEIIEHQNDYVGVPLVCDLNSLFSRQKLTHLYNEDNDSFDTAQIGSFYSFEIEKRITDSVLVGYCRIPKRNPEICTELYRLYELGQLKFSFEILCGACKETEDGITVIDVGEHNKLTALCVVTKPACPSSVALQMVAEAENYDYHNEHKEENIMNENNVSIEINVETPEVNAEVIAEANEGENTTTEETTEEIVAEQSTVQSESATEETAIADSTETAAAIEEAECKKNSEDEEAECCKKSEEETAGCCKKSECNDCNDDDCDDDEDCENASCKKAEIDNTDIISIIKSLEERIVSLETKLSEINTAASTYSSMFNNNSCFTSEQHSVVAEEINPMTSDITIESEWTLLEREEPITTWTLI